MRSSRAAAVLAAVFMIAARVQPGQAMSFEEERKLGRQFALAARIRLPLVHDPEVVGYVKAIGQRIVRSLEQSVFDYEFAVVRDASVNAFAVPGGYIYVTTGLIARASSDDEIAGVLSHEIAHIHNRHLVRQQEATQLMNYATLLGILAGAMQPAVGALATAANVAMQLKYRREFEQEADYAGARYLKMASFDPHGMLDFFKKLADDQRRTPTFLPPYVMSHPLTDERLNHLEAVLRTPQWSKKKRNPKSFALADAQVRARIRTEPPADVVHAYQRALEADPGNAVARYLYGVACLELGQLETARTALEGARDAGVGAAYREIGRLALRSRKIPEARENLKKAVELDPRDAGAHADLGQALEALGENEAAIEAYRTAIALAPDLEQAHYRLAVLAGRSGAESEGFFHLATALHLRGEYEPALKQYVRAQAALPQSDPRSATVRAASEELSDFLNVAAAREEKTPRR